MTERQTAVVKAQGGAVALPMSVDPVLELIDRAARDPAVDPAKLTALFDLRERYEAKQAKLNFTAAFARMMLRMPRVEKDGTISLVKDGICKGSIPFGTWENVDAVIRPILAEFGFVLSFTTAAAPGVIEMTGHLRHVDGHEDTSALQLPPDKGPGRNELQAVHSSHSYGKRILSIDMLNIVFKGKDDAGRAAAFISEEQAMTIETAIKDTGMTAASIELFLKLANTDMIRHIRQCDYDRLVEALKLKLKQKEQREARR
jgi:hypothetical protein